MKFSSLTVHCLVPSEGGRPCVLGDYYWYRWRDRLWGLTKLRLMNFNYRPVIWRNGSRILLQVWILTKTKLKGLEKINHTINLLIRPIVRFPQDSCCFKIESFYLFIIKILSIQQYRKNSEHPYDHHLDLTQWLLNYTCFIYIFLQHFKVKGRHGNISP